MEEPIRIQIEKELKELGISATMRFSDVNDWDEPHEKPAYDILVVFNSQEDMNLYKLIGTWKENWYIKFTFAEVIK